MLLRACEACHRHVAITAPTCPFCAVDLTPAASRIDAVARLSRRAVFAAALAGTACWSGSPPPRDTPIERDHGPLPAGTIRGLMRDTRNGRLLPGVEVRLDGPSGLRRATSDAEGRFVLDHLAPGKYLLYYRAPHHQHELWMEVLLDATRGQLVEVPIYFPRPGDTPCCMPYGAPPARRRLV